MLTQLRKALRLVIIMQNDDPEFVSRAVLQWLTQSNIDIACIDSRQALAEWIERIFQRQVPRRMPVDTMIQESDRCEDDEGSTTLEPWQADTCRVQTNPGNNNSDNRYLLSIQWSGENRQVRASDIAKASRTSLEGLAAGYSVEVKVTGHSYDQVIGEASMGSWNLAETQANRGMVTVEHNWFFSAHDKLLEAEGYAKQRDAGVWRERPG